MVFHGAGGDAADARVRGARPQRTLVLQQLSHEREVGRDVRLDALDVLVGAVQRVVEELHEVSEDNGHRARHAGVAVNQDSLAGETSSLDEAERLGEVLDHVDVVRVFHGYLLVVQPCREEVVRDTGSDVEDISDAACFETREACGDLSTAEVEMGKDLVRGGVSLRGAGFVLGRGGVRVLRLARVVLDAERHGGDLQEKAAGPSLEEGVLGRVGDVAESGEPCEEPVVASLEEHHVLAVPRDLPQHERSDGFLGEGLGVRGVLVVHDDAHSLRVFRRHVLGLVFGRVEERLHF